MSSSSSSGPSIGSNLALSIHSEILAADIPEDPSSKSNLIDELKNRARVCIQQRNYPTAETLYTKAIAVSEIDGKSSPSIKEEQDAAILFSNRSLVFLNMNDLDKSLADAQRATKLDPKYVKGFWRLGSTFAAKEQWREAIEAFKDAVILEPQNKALLKEVERCQKMKIKADEKKQLEAENNSEEKKDDESSKVTTKTVTKTITKTSTSTSTSTAPKAKTEKVVSNEDDSEFSKSDHIRGYKIVGDKKTSFFHHEQTEEEKRLIGDIAPKRIDPTTAQASAPAVDKPKNVSAWNNAGTWEEKDVTAWATETLQAQILLSEFQLPPSSPSPGSVCRVSNVKKCDGHASVATARGKRRYIYEFAVVVEWEMTLPQEDEVAKGTMTFPDIDGTCDRGEYEMMNYTVDATCNIPSSARHLLDRFVRNGGLRDEIVNRIDQWVDCLKSTYA